MSDSATRAIVELALTPQQIAILKPLLLQEPRQPVFFVSTCSSYFNGAIKSWKWQVERLTQKQATKVMKLLREPGKPRSKEIVAPNEVTV